MNSLLKRIIKVILILALIMCWGISLGYANNIESKEKLINFYFESDNYNVEFLKNIEESKKELSLVGWREESLQSATNPDLNRTTSDLDVLLINGPSNLLAKGSMLFKDDKDGCLIDEETSFKLFGSNNCLGKTIVYNERNLIIRGILKGTKANMMLQLPEGAELALDGLTIDGTDFTLNKIEEFKSQFGIQEMAINGGVYYLLAKAIAMILPILALILIMIKIIVSAFKARNKPVLLAIYIVMCIFSIFIVFKITKIHISIPLDMIPNKWSDFDFWSKMWKEYSEKIQYVMYMKKSGIDIYNIENLLKSVLFSILAIILFIINLNVIKIKDIKELIVNNAISVICTFIAVLIIWSKFSFDVNITMLWLIYPLYLCANYFMNLHHKYLIQDEKLENNNEINIKDEAFC